MGIAPRLQRAWPRGSESLPRPHSRSGPTTRECQAKQTPALLQGQAESVVTADSFLSAIYNAFAWPFSIGGERMTQRTYVMQATQQQPRQFLRLKQVEAKTGYRRSTLYAKIKAGEFPNSYALGARAVGWLNSDVENWIEARIQAAGGAE